MSLKNVGSTPSNALDFATVSGVTSAITASAPQVFNHGTNAAAIRPVTSGPVFWVGSVSPSNWLNGDLWFDTTSGGTTLPTMPSGLVAHWSVKDLALANGATVSSWADRVGGLALTPTSTPTYSSTADAVSYDGVDDMHNATLAVAQPTTFVTVFRLPVSTVSQPIFGSATAVHSISTSSGSLLQLNAGTALSQAGAVTANQWMMVSSVANGASSGLSVNAGTRTTGTAGTNGRATVRVASNTAGTSFSRLEMKAALVFNRALTDAELIDVKTLLNNDLGLTL